MFKLFQKFLLIKLIILEARGSGPCYPVWSILAPHNEIRGQLCRAAQDSSTFIYFLFVAFLIFGNFINLHNCVYYYINALILSVQAVESGRDHVLDASHCSYIHARIYGPKFTQPNFVGVYAFDFSTSRIIVIPKMTIFPCYPSSFNLCQQQSRADSSLHLANSIV